MVEGTQLALSAMRALAKTCESVLSTIGADMDETLEPWRHYPEDDVYDAEHQSQYYFHKHQDSPPSPTEVGHFHTFVRSEVLQDTHEAQNPQSGLCHLVGISVAANGYPAGLFTTNRWVTNETWHPAAQAIALLDMFRVDHTRPNWATNLWITACVQAYRPLIIELIQERDRRIEEHITKTGDTAPLENKELNVLSYRAIDLDRHIATLYRAQHHVRA